MSASPSEASGRRIRTICVYCGSSPGGEPAYHLAARALGQAMGAAGIGLVYGGGHLGLMGSIASAVGEAGGKVTGIIPEFLVSPSVSLGADHENIVVPDMHARKRMMFERADAFVALPGGVGTLEELVEQLTWVQLGRHSKPVVLADIGGFWRPLLSLFAHMRQEGFIPSHYEVHYLVAQSIEEVLPMIEAAAAQNEKRGFRQEGLDPRL